MIYLDTEDMGFVGPTTLVQWARDDDPISLHEVWRTPCRETLLLLEQIVDSEVCGFNLVFDWFHVQRLYCVLRLLDPALPPTPKGWKAVEREAVRGPCLKPRAAMDLMLHAMRGPAQSLMERDDVRIKKVPAQLAPWLAQELHASIKLDPIYFEKRADGYEWHLDDHDGHQADFPDVVLRWGASRGLKPLAKHLLGAEVQSISEKLVEGQWKPEEDGWNPFGDDWLRVHDYHVAFWQHDATARRYARDDVELTRGLWKHFGRPGAGDVDSTLACQVGSSRWRGYALDLPLVAQIEAEAARLMELAPRAPKTVLHGLRSRCSPIEALAIEDTAMETLQEIAGTRDKGGWAGGWGDDHAAAQFARTVVVARSKEKERDVCRKLLTVGSFHPDMKIIGALSGRMAGAGGLNAQGIPGSQKGSRLRSAFLLADDGEELDAGDFDSFEVVIAAAVYDDANLTAALRSGKKIHAIYGEIMYQLDYAKVKGDPTLYNTSKRGFLGRMYGAQDPKTAEVFGLPIEVVQSRERVLEDRFPGIGRAREGVAQRFCSMRQPNGIGSRVEWHEPADYQESLFGFRRYFTLENTICRALFGMAQHPPESIRLGGAKVQRRLGRFQTPGGATQSALYACAFGIQASAMRQAANHEIQSSGAWITKNLQARIWEEQPCGIHPWRVRPLQIHDEIQCPRQPDVDLRPSVEATIEQFRGKVPLLKMEWLRGIRNWGEKA